MCLQIKLESEITARKITNSRYAKMLHLKRMLDVVADIKERFRFSLIISRRRETSKIIRKIIHAQRQPMSENRT